MNMNLKGERNYFHSTNVVKSLNFISRFTTINKIQFNNYMKSKPKVFISRIANYKKTEKCFIEIEIEYKNTYILHMEASEKIISRRIPYSEEIKNYKLKDKSIVFEKSNNLDVFESIIAGNKVLCNDIIQRDSKWAAVRISFKDFNLLKKKIQEISILNVKVVQNLWFESVVLIDDEVLCNILFKKE